MCATGRSIQWIRTRWDLCAAIGTTKMSFFYYSFHNSLAKCNAFDISCAASMQRHVHNAVVSWLLAPFVDSTEIRGEKLNIEMEMEEWTWTIFVWCFCSFTRHRIAWWIHKMAQEGDREIASNPKKSAFVCVCVSAVRGTAKPMMPINDKRIHIALILIECRWFLFPASFRLICHWFKQAVAHQQKPNSKNKCINIWCT